MERWLNFPLHTPISAAPDAALPQDVRCRHPGSQEQDQASRLLGHRVSWVYEFGSLHCQAASLLITTRQPCCCWTAAPHQGIPSHASTIESDWLWFPASSNYSIYRIPQRAVPLRAL